MRLAKKAVTSGLSPPELAEEVQKARAQGSPGARGGRPCPPAFVKGLHRLGKAIELVVSEAVGEGTFASYCPAKARALLETLEGQMEVLAELKGRVLAAAAVFEVGEGGDGEDAGDEAGDEA